MMTAPKVHRAPITMNHGMPRSTQTNPVENPLEPCRDRFETSKKTRQTPAHTHTHTHTQQTGGRRNAEVKSEATNGGRGRGHVTSRWSSIGPPAVSPFRMQIRPLRSPLLSLRFLSLSFALLVVVVVAVVVAVVAAVVVAAVVDCPKRPFPRRPPLRCKYDVQRKANGKKSVKNKLGTKTSSASIFDVHFSCSDFVSLSVAGKKTTPSIDLISTTARPHRKTQ